VRKRLWTRSSAHGPHWARSMVDRPPWPAMELLRAWPTAALVAKGVLDGSGR
jgi:hypothetical protein